MGEIVWFRKDVAGPLSRYEVMERRLDGNILVVAVDKPKDKALLIREMPIDDRIGQLEGYFHFGN